MAKALIRPDRARPYSTVQALLFGAGALASVLGFVLQMALLAGIVMLVMAFFRNRSGQPAYAGASASRGSTTSINNAYRATPSSLGGGSAALSLQQADFDAFERLLGEIREKEGWNDPGRVRGSAAGVAEAIRNGTIAGAGLDVFAKEPTTESPLFGLPEVVVTPHLGASTVEAQDKAGITIADMVVLALKGEFVPFAVNLAAREASATIQPFLPLAERLGQLFIALADGSVDTLEVSYEGQIADYDCKVLTLAALESGVDLADGEEYLLVGRLVSQRGGRILFRVDLQHA